VTTGCRRRDGEAWGLATVLMATIMRRAASRRADELRPAIQGDALQRGGAATSSNRRLPPATAPLDPNKAAVDQAAGPRLGGGRAHGGHVAKLPGRRSIAGTEGKNCAANLFMRPQSSLPIHDAHCLPMAGAGILPLTASSHRTC